MADQSSPLSPPADESIEAETDTALEPELELGEPAPDASSEPGFVCDCEASMRSACKGLPFYKEHESRSYCVLHYPGKEKSADFKAAFDIKLTKQDFDFRGVWFPNEVDFSRFEFGADAYFTFAIFSDTANFRLVRFIGSSDFRSATFRETAYCTSGMFGATAIFRSATFKKAADFGSAKFVANADFSSVTFGADAFLVSATFNGNADFSSATFGSDAYFSSSTFAAKADFSSASFGASAYFGAATFGSHADFDLSIFDARGDFSHALFNDSIHFFGSATKRKSRRETSLEPMTLGKDPSLDFQHVKLERADRVAFQTLNLQPSWFVNVDPRQFVFTDVSWQWERIRVEHEVSALEGKGVSSSAVLLTKACHQLAENAEASHRYEDASLFRYWAMDLARRSKWKGWSFWQTDWLHIVYWLVSGYGEKIRRSLGVLVGVWIVFVLLYTQVGFKQKLQKASSEGASSETAIVTIEDRTGKPLEFSRALTYSLAVMSLQKPEPKPLTGTAQTLVLLETILGPVQAALLALAIRRKFMR